MEKNSEVSGAWYRDIFIGDSNRTNDELAWTNLVITDTSKRAFFEVYVEAFTGNVSNDVTLPQVILTIEAAPNKAPYFLMEPDSEIFINLNSLGNSTVFRVKMPDIYDVNVWDLIRVEVFGSSVIQPLLSFDMETGILTLKGVTDQLKGDHEILIRISDEYDAETTYEIVLKVTRPAFEGFVIQEVSYEEEVAEIVEQEIVVEKSTKPVNAKITSID